MRRNDEKAARLSRAEGCARLLCCAGLAATAQARIAASWTNPAGGLWTNGLNWSSSPTPPGAPGDQATIDLVAGAPYTVTLNAPISLSGLILNSADAILAHTGGALDLQGDLDLRAGQFRMSGGATLRHAHVLGNGGSLTLTGDSTLESVALDANATISGGFAVARDSLTIGAGRSLRLAGPATTLALTVTNPVSAMTLGGGGEIVFDTPGSFLNAFVSIVMIGPDFTIRSGLAGGTLGSQNGLYLNQGLVSSRTAGQSITLNSGFFNETNGVLEARDGGSLLFRGCDISKGTVTVLNGGTLDIGAGSTIGAGATFQTAAGVVNMTGPVMNAGALVLNAATGSWNLRGGKITGGSLATAAGAALVVPAGLSGTVDGLVNSGEISAMSGSTLTLQGNWQNSGLLRFTNSTVNLDGAFRLNPGSTIVRSGGTVTLRGTLDNSGNTLAMDQSWGPIKLSFGGISGGTIAPNGLDALDISFGSMNGVTLGGDVALKGNGQLFVNGNNLNSHSLFIRGHLQLLCGGSPFVGPGEIVFDTADGQSSGTVQPRSVPIGLGVVIRTGLDGGTVGAFEEALRNEGRLTAQTAGKTLTVRGQNWVNAITGVLQSDAGTLNAVENWTNEGQLRIGNGTMILGNGNIAWKPTASILRYGMGELRLGASMELAGGTLALNDLTGAITMVGGEIRHGTVLGTGAGRLVATGGGADRGLQGVTLGADMEIMGGGSIYVSENLALLGPTITITNNGFFSFRGTQGMTGAASVFFDGNNAGLLESVRGSNPTSLLDIAHGITIATRTGGGRITAQDSLVSHGLISARTPGKTITLTSVTNAADGVLEARSGATLRTAGAWTNLGTIDLDNANLELGGTFTLPGALHRTGGTVTLTGVLDNTGRTLALDAALGPWVMSNGTIKGGVVEAGPGGGLSMGVGNTLAIFSSVTLRNAMLEAFAGQTVVSQGSGLTLDNSSVHLWGATMNFEHPTGAPSQHLSGDGAIVLRGGTSVMSPGRLVIDPGAAIRTELATANLTASGEFRNRGLISAASPGSVFTLTGLLNDYGATLEAKNGGTLTLSLWSNAGTIVVENGTLNLGGTFTPATMGTIQRAGGTVNLTGTLHGYGSTLALNDQTGPWNLRGGTIQGGEVRGAGTGELFVPASQTAVLRDTLLGAHLTVGNNATLNVQTALALDNATIRLQGGAQHARVTFDTGLTPTGTGQIVLDGATGRNTVAASGSSGLSIGQGVTIRTGLGGGFVGATTNGLVNHGVIDAALAGAVVEIAGLNWTNAATGEIRARTSGQATLKGSFTNSGTLVADAGTLRVEGVMTAPASARLEARNGGAVNLLSPTAVTNNGQILVESGGVVKFFSNLALASAGEATVVLGGSAASASGQLHTTGATFVAPDSLSIILGPSFQPRWGDSFTILQYQTITGSDVLLALDLPELADTESLRWWRSVGLAAFTIGVRSVADTNHDNTVDFLDLNNVLGQFGQSGSGLIGDADENGSVDFLDLNAVLGAFGQQAPAAVPSPSTLALAGAGAMRLGLRRRR